MTIEENLRAIVREEMRPVELKLTLMASLIQQLCKELDESRCPARSTIATFPSDARRGNFTLVVDRPGP